MPKWSVIDIMRLRRYVSYRHSTLTHIMGGSSSKPVASPPAPGLSAQDKAVYDVKVQRDRLTKYAANVRACWWTIHSLGLL